MAKNDEKLKELLERAEQGTKEVFESDNYRNYLATMSKFHSYSYRNSLLILLQKPEASYVAGYSAWQKKFNRQVQKGEKGIQIVGYTPKKVNVEQERKDTNGKTIIGADGKPVMDKVTKQIPAFMPVYVYDVSQTAGDPLPQLINELDGSVEVYQDLMQSIEEASPFPISFEDIQGGAKGFCDPINQKIVIQQGMSEAQTVKTAIHEVTHADLHAPELNLALNDRTDRRTREVEAESTAFVVCNHYGIDTSDYTFPYLASWSSTRELKELQNSLDTIQKQAGELIDRIDTRLAELQKNRENQIFTEISPDKVKDLVQAFDQNSDRPFSKYLAKDKGSWIAVDDSTHNCNVEVFPNRKTAIDWLAGKFEMSEYYDRPDKSVSVEDMEQYGFSNNPELGIDMLPVEQERATTFFEKEVPVFMLYSNSTAISIDSTDQIKDHAAKGGLFGVQSNDWEQHRYFEQKAFDLAQKYDRLIGDDQNGRIAHPFSIEDIQSRLDLIANRISNFDIASLDLIVDQVISKIPESQSDRQNALTHELQGIKNEYEHYQQERLSIDVQRFAGEPVLVVKWSENPSLQTGQVFPLHEANSIFKKLDEAYPQEQGYEKTAFSLKYKLAGEYGVYEGRQDFGDREGGVIDHIKTLWEYELTPEQTAIHTAHGNESIIEHATDALERFVPYLQAHDTLGKLFDYTEKQLSDLKTMLDLGSSINGGEQLLAYHNAMKLYINEFREALNNEGIYPEMPQRSEYGLSEINDVSLTPEYRADIEAMASYREEIKKEIATEAKQAGITEDQYIAAGSIPPAGRSFSIYQMKDGEQTRGIRFESLNFLRQENIGVTPSLVMYDKIYSGELPEGKGLEDIFTEFNINRPADFTGHSLSISDIIVIEYQGEITANYIDRFGFENLPDFVAEIKAQTDIEADQKQAAIDRNNSLKFDLDIDLDREKTRDQLGFRDTDKEQRPQPQKRMSMKDRLAAAQAEADRRATGRSESNQQHKQEKERGDI